MIFLTGAAGKTGKAILNSLSNLNAEAMALVRSEEQAARISPSGNCKPVIGDLRIPSSFENEIKTAAIIYYICPNIAPDELEIGKNLIRLAQKYGVKRFVYHSVLHPQIEAMPHHWQKMHMEEALFESGLDFTILQPCAYMQNMLTGWSSIKSGRYVTPYKTSVRISIVDLKDVAEAAAKVMTSSEYSYGIYELSGPEPLSQLEVSEQLSRTLNISVKAVEQPRQDWLQNALQHGMQQSQAMILLKMFEYYDQYGLTGNPTSLNHLLGRKAASFQMFLERILKSGEELTNG